MQINVTAHNQNGARVGAWGVDRKKLWDSLIANADPKFVHGFTVDGFGIVRVERRHSDGVFTGVLLGIRDGEFAFLVREDFDA